MGANPCTRSSAPGALPTHCVKEVANGGEGALPAGHGCGGLAAPVQKVPGRHAVQKASPGAASHHPAGHTGAGFWHAVIRNDTGAVAGHCRHAVRALPPGLYVGAGHGTQGVPYVPARHTVHAVEPAVEAKVPLEHAEHAELPLLAA